MTTTYAEPNAITIARLGSVPVLLALARYEKEMAFAVLLFVALGSDVAVDFRPRATCAVCLVQEGGAFWAHIGDSRIYQVRNGKVLNRSRDHSHVEVLIQEGAITEEEALDHPMRNFVECCIGGDAPVPDMSITSKQPLAPGDVLLACTDGLTGLYNHRAFQEELARQVALLHL